MSLQYAASGVQRQQKCVTSIPGWIGTSPNVFIGDQICEEKIDPVGFMFLQQGEEKIDPVGFMFLQQGRLKKI